MTGYSKVRIALLAVLARLSGGLALSVAPLPAQADLATRSAPESLSALQLPAAAGSRPAANLAGGPGSAQRTLATLDRNHDGVVDPKEVEEFARSQGLDVRSVTQDFMEIDLNGDGRLDADEIKGALEGGASQKPQPTSPLQMPAPPPQAPAGPPGGKAAPAQKLAEKPEAEQSRERLHEELGERRRLEDGTLAGEFADTEAHEATALALQQKATELRVNATAVAKAAAQKAAEAGHRAARDAALRVLKRIDELESEAEKADVTAAALRAKTKMELMVADSLLAAAASASGGK